MNEFFNVLDHDKSMERKTTREFVNYNLQVTSLIKWYCKLSAYRK